MIRIGGNRLSRDGERYLFARFANQRSFLGSLAQQKQVRARADTRHGSTPPQAVYVLVLMLLRSSAQIAAISLRPHLLLRRR